MFRETAVEVKREVEAALIPSGTKGGDGIVTGILAICKPGNIADVGRQATQWVEAAVMAVRQAEEPNPWVNASDEEIAGEIWKGVERKLAERKVK